MIALQELARKYRDELDVKVVGITGSNGKTTTKDITADLLSLKYKVKKTEGNFNNEIGLPLTILGLEEDTEIAVLEMGMSSKGEIDFDYIYFSKNYEGGSISISCYYRYYNYCNYD